MSLCHTIATLELSLIGIWTEQMEKLALKMTTVVLGLTKGPQGFLEAFGLTKMGQFNVPLVFN